ncbi:GxxExxY protein [Candidatus Microgenomates bacterium]|nr:GxxExxY protein [Candidatus Microgenomates bacterium]
MAVLIYPELSYKIIGVLFKVHSELGNSYQEKYYQRAVEIELTGQGLSFNKEIAVDLSFADQKIGKYFLDFLIDDKIILELKAKPTLHKNDFRLGSSLSPSKKLKVRNFS